MARRICSFGSLAAVHLTAIAAVGGIAPAPAGAQVSDPASLDVLATIVQSCKIEGVGVLDFGEIHDNEDKSAQTNLTFSCTFGGEQFIDVDIDMGRQPFNNERYLSKNGSSSDIFYKLCVDAACETLWSNPVEHTIDNDNTPLTVYAQIPAIGALSDFEAGEYTDTLTVTLSY